MSTDGEHAVFEHVDRYLMIGQESGASDVHLGVNMPPLWRRNGNLEPIFRLAPRLNEDDTKRLAHSFLDEAQIERLEGQGDVDFAYSNAFGRFRTSVVRQRLGIDIVFRIISTKLRTMDEIGLPQSLKKLTEYHNGLVLVTGPVGSGKSTTLAAMVQEINLHRHDHIITLEDPIEYIIKAAGCHVTQREVHSHTRSFAAALRGALREDPDVIMVGEMRDLETISLAISASEPGIWSSAHCTRAVPPVRSTACWTCSPSISASRFASWSARVCAASSASNSCPARTAKAGRWRWRC